MITIPAWLRPEVAPAATRGVPERLAGTTTTLLLSCDAAAVAIVAIGIGFPLNALPALCLLVCSALYAVGGARISYALNRRDEVYHVLAAVALAAIPLVIALVVIGGMSLWRTLLVLPLAAVVVAPIHLFAHAVRAGDSVGDGSLDAVSPKRKRYATLVTVRGWRKTIDVLLAAVASVVALPVIVAIACALLWQSGTPALFMQERVGRDRHRFTMLKFRTMRPDAGTQWAKAGDERITRFGAFLRRTSLDELPQLFNVLRGEMALVGPRPEMPEFAEEFRATIPHYDERVLVLPGLTGWAQVNLNRNLMPSDMGTVVPYDLFYVEHASFGLDLFILMKTLCEIWTHEAV
jgi:lipopolysaccharide/colanic/teichoic acid biosynthesis glycosyltransferase